MTLFRLCNNANDAMPKDIDCIYWKLVSSNVSHIFRILCRIGNGIKWISKYQAITHAIIQIKNNEKNNPGDIKCWSPFALSLDSTFSSIFLTLHYVLHLLVPQSFMMHYVQRTYHMYMYTSVVRYSSIFYSFMHSFITKHNE